MKAVIRAFIAIDLSPEIQQKMEEVSAHLRENLKEIPIRWVQVENIHLTLKFLGDVSLSNLEVLKKMLMTEVAGHVPFEISVGKLGAFPNSHQPRVIWIGVEGPSELKAVQYGVETQMERLGYTREERPFFPHLTFGRVSRNASSHDLRHIGEVLEDTRVGSLGSTQVRTINLYKSDLQPGGAVYTCLFSAPLSTPS
jgi:2'-5' RNA ligase